MKALVCTQFGPPDALAIADCPAPSAGAKQIVVRVSAAGVDVVIDPVGDRYAEPAVRGMAWNGRYCVIGFAAGEIPKIPLNLLLLKGCSIVGVAVNSNARHDPTEYRENFAQLMEWIAAGKLEPVVTATYPLARAADALADALARRIQGKVVVTPG